MEILFELEDSVLVIEFTPDFKLPNHAKHTYVQWELSNRPDKSSLADLFIELPEEQSISPPGNRLDSLRLLRRRDS